MKKTCELCGKEAEELFWCYIDNLNLCRPCFDDRDE